MDLYIYTQTVAKVRDNITYLTIKCIRSKQHIYTQETGCKLSDALGNKIFAAVWLNRIQIIRKMNYIILMLLMIEYE